MEQLEFLDKYEANLMQDELRLCRDLGELDNRLLETPDISEKWDGIVQEYMLDSIKEIANYPTVALGWAMYVGMAVAKYWDEDWAIYDKVENLYIHIRDKRGYDYLDEVVRGEIFGLKDEAYTHCEDIVRSCAQSALDHIRHEQIEPQSPMAYYVYARSIKVLYKIGAAVALKRLGYKMEAI